MDSTSLSFASIPGGEETLYASCFACMFYHYLGKLEQLDIDRKKQWADYFNSWQDPDSGYFIGPELIKADLTSTKHSYEHLAHHLTVHVLPSLKLLGHNPAYPLTFAHSYLDQIYLKNWLDARDWRDAWLDQRQDPATELWGSNRYCSNAAALYGGYHQLLVYYYEKRPVQYPERLIDVALSLTTPRWRL